MSTLLLKGASETVEETQPCSSEKGQNWELLALCNNTAHAKLHDMALFPHVLTFKPNVNLIFTCTKSFTELQKHLKYF